jgi:hypothetical protein
MARRRSSPKGSESRFDGFSRRTQVILALAGALVAVVTGMVALVRDVAPDHESSAGAAAPVMASAEYQRRVGDVCGTLNDDDLTHARDVRRLKRQLRADHTTVAQRDHLLQATYRTLHTAEAARTTFAALAAPSAGGEAVARATRAWDKTIERLRAYAHGLDAADRRADVVVAIHRLSDARPQFERDRTAYRTELARLGEGQCRLEPVRTPEVVPLPALHGRGHGEVGPNAVTDGGTPRAVGSDPPSKLAPSGAAPAQVPPTATGVSPPPIDPDSSPPGAGPSG